MKEDYIKVPSLVFAAFAALAMAGLPAGAQGYSFETFRVPYPPGGDSDTAAQGIDNYGRVTGYFDFPITSYSGRRVGFVRHPGGAFEYPIKSPNGSFTMPRGINSAGTIAGSFYLSGGYQGFVLTNGVFSPIDFGRGTEVHAINNRGDMVGVGGGWRQPAFFLPNDGPAITISVGDGVTFLNGVAWDRTMVGCYEWQGETMALVRGPKGNSFGFRFPGARSLCATGINNAAGLIVGVWTDNEWSPHGFIYDYRSDLADAEALMSASAASAAAPIPVRTVQVEIVDAPDHGWITGINAQGQIVGHSYAGALNTRSYGFIGTPVR